MVKFLSKNSLYLTTTAGLGVLFYLVLNWTSISILQRLVCFMMIAITMHEWEEKLFGFAELTSQNLNVSADKVDNNIGHFALFVLTLYIGIVPLFFPDTIWLSTTAMVLGILEMVSHIAAIRMEKKGKSYTAGMVTAFSILPVLSIYGFFYIISNKLMQPAGWGWLYAVLNLLIPLLAAQNIAVRSMGVNYNEFMKNTFNKILKGKK